MWRNSDGRGQLIACISPPRCLLVGVLSPLQWEYKSYSPILYCFNLMGVTNLAYYVLRLLMHIPVGRQIAV